MFVYDGTHWSQQAYVKASNTRANASFGSSVVLSADGSTLVVGASGESSNATGINGNQCDTSAMYAGAAYVFTRSGTTWSQQAYLKASNTRANASFGSGTYGSEGFAISSDGNTLAVGASGDSSNAMGVNGDQGDTSAANAGSRRMETRSLVVGAQAESSNSTGLNGNQSDTSAEFASAAYPFTRTGTTWSQKTYLNASNARAGSRFGFSVALVGDVLAVGAVTESSDATDINGNQADTSAPTTGAVYLFR